jgi:hypothetical protein
MKRLLLVLVLVLAANAAWGAQAIVTSEKTIEVLVTTDTSDWLWSSVSSSPGKLLGIVFNPGAVGDKLIIRNGSITGPKIVLLSSDGEARGVSTFGASYRPCIDYSECTFTAGASVLFLFSSY